MGSQYSGNKNFSSKRNSYRKTNASLTKNYFHPYAQNYFDRVISSGSSLTDSAKTAINKYIISLVSAGLWDKIIDMGLFCGPSNLVGALTKLKYTTSSRLINTNFIEADYISTGANAGLIGNGTNKFLDTMFTPNVLGHSLGVYFSDNAEVASSRCILGIEDSVVTAGDARQSLHASSTSLASMGMRTFTGNFSSKTRANGLLLGRYNPFTNVIQSSYNGEPYSTSTATFSNVYLSSSPFGVFARNAFGVGSAYSASRLAFYVIGTQFWTDADTANFNNISKLFLASFGIMF